MPMLHLNMRMMGLSLLLGHISDASPTSPLGHAAACDGAGGAEDSVCTPEEQSLLQTRKQRQGEIQPAWKSSGQPLTQALVDEVWTYGAPATHEQPFRNAAREDECFPGLRSYTEDLKGVGGSIHQVDAASMNNYFPHATTNSVVLHKGGDSYYNPCREHKEFGHPEMPQRGPSVFIEWRLHQEDDYQERLDAITVHGKDVSTEEPFKSAREYVLFAWKSYDTVANTKRQMAERMPNWRLVRREVYKTYNDEDPVMVIQQQRTLDCALVFTGTNSGADLPSSTTQYKTGYCGFTGVHVGVRNELWTITDAIWKKVRVSLEQCNRVLCVGHSLGGALCELFSACANSGNTTDPDFRLLAWDKAKHPRRMPEMKTPQTDKAWYR